MQIFFDMTKVTPHALIVRILRGSCELATRLPFTILGSVFPSASLCKTGLQTYFLMTILGASTTEDPKTAWDGTWKGAAAAVFTFFSRAHRLRVLAVRISRLERRKAQWLMRRWSANQRCSSEGALIWGHLLVKHFHFISPFDNFPRDTPRIQGSGLDTAVIWIQIRGIILTHFTHCHWIKTTIAGEPYPKWISTFVVD